MSKVFISWSGPVAEKVAAALREWLAKVLDDRVSAFVSSEDIAKGDRGLNRIAAELEASDFGIVIVTPGNQNSPWVNFEAGALGKSVADGRVAPLLVGMSDPELSGPLRQFQNSAAGRKAEVAKLVSSVNASLEVPLTPQTLGVVFEACWPELEAVIIAATEETSEKSDETRRDPTEILDEVLSTVRSMQRDVGRLQGAVGMPPNGAREKIVQLGFRLLRRSLKVTAQSAEFDDDGVVFHLPPDAPAVKSDVLRVLQDLAVVYEMSVAIQRPTGEAVKYNTDGKESRTAATLVPADETDLEPEPAEAL